MFLELTKNVFAQVFYCHFDNNLRNNHKKKIRQNIIQKYNQKDVWNATIEEYHNIINEYL